MINPGHLRRSGKRMSPRPKRGYRCKHCGSNAHYSYTCFSKPNKPIKAESFAKKAKRMSTRARWFKDNPSDDGYWSCYLGIADDCLIVVDTTTIDLEHVRSKARHPKLRYEPFNIKPACQPCNKLKRSWSLEELAETYPNIAKMIATPEWIEYENELTRIEES